MARLSLVLLLLALGPGLAQAATKLANFARFDLEAGATVGSLTNAQILLGDGAIDRQNWRPTSEWPRSYTISLAIVRWEWTKLVVRFVPQRTGAVTLKLMGPWEQPPGSTSIYQEEVLWDALEATGARVPNPSFELLSGSTIVSWSGGRSQTATASVPVVQGTRCARTWHDGPMSCTLSVTGGMPVVLTFYARAVVPAGFTDMQRVNDPNTPAHQAALKFMRGVNFGNALEFAPGTPGALTYNATDFTLARSEGFDHVRLPVAWHFYTGPEPAYTLSNTIFSKVDPLVDNAVSRGLGVVIDWHHFNEFTADPTANANKFYAVWRQIAGHYANRPATVAFELLNEPKDKATTAAISPVFAEAIRQIRISNPTRPIFVGTGQFNNLDELNGLLLPDTDANLIATVHCYDPFYFTHQGASWVSADFSTVGVVFPGPPQTPLAAGPKATNSWVKSWLEFYNAQPTENNPSSPLAFRGRLQRARAWAEYWGRPVYVGEFGAYETADPQSRVNFCREMRQAMDAAGLGWAIWDWKAGFHYQRNGAPDPPAMREAIFPSFQLRSPGSGVIAFDAARGKTFVVEKTVALRGPIAWQTISTQTLVSPDFLFTDPGAGAPGAGFYRVKWMK